MITTYWKYKRRYKSLSPLLLLQAMYNLQIDRKGCPENETDYVKVRTGELLEASNLKNTSAQYCNVTKILEAGWISVSSDPEHSQAFLYNITLAGIEFYEDLISELETSIDTSDGSWDELIHRI